MCDSLKPGDMYEVNGAIFSIIRESGDGSEYAPREFYVSAVHEELYVPVKTSLYRRKLSEEEKLRYKLEQ